LALLLRQGMHGVEEFGLLCPGRGVRFDFETGRGFELVEEEASSHADLGLSLGLMVLVIVVVERTRVGCFSKASSSGAMALDRRNLIFFERSFVAEGAVVGGVLGTMALLDMRLSGVEKSDSGDMEGSTTVLLLKQQTSFSSFSSSSSSSFGSGSTSKVELIVVV